MGGNRLPVLNKLLTRAVNSFSKEHDPKYVGGALGGKENFEKDFANSHVKTNTFQKILLGLGSGVISITNPRRGDMIAVNGEVTGSQALEYILSKMLESSEGRRILEEKPRISSAAINLEKLKGYPEGTLGKSYSNFLEKYGYTPDARNAVKFVDDLELAYVAQRYREVHDLFHTLLNMPTNMLGEVTVKWVEAIQTKLPMCAAGALFGSIRLAPKSRRYYSTKTVLLDSSDREKLESGQITVRQHSGKMSLPCTNTPEEISLGIQCVLEKEDKKTLKKESEKFDRQLECRHVPLEGDDIEYHKNYFYEAILRKNPRIDLSDEKNQERVNQNIRKRLKSLTNMWRGFDYDRMQCLQYLLSRGPSEYAVVKRVFYEIAKNDKEFAPKYLFDFGSGVGTVEWAAHHYWGTTIKEYYCVDASKHMNELSDLILRQNNCDNEPFIKNIYYRQFLPATATPYDVVVSSFSFLELPNRVERIKTLINLWNKTDKYFVLIENGSNAGFNIIVEARDFILSTSKVHGIECYVFAPCPHDFECPRLNAEGKKTPCNFEMKYRKLFQENITGNKLFSFLIMKKGKKRPESERRCRIVREVIKRKNLCCCHLCTNEGELTTIYASKKKSEKYAYKCLRATKWGDLLPGKLVDSIETPQKDWGEYISDDESSSSDESSDDSDDEKDTTQDSGFKPDEKPKQTFKDEALNK